MKLPVLPLGAALLLALSVTGCETDKGIATRSQEKAAAYAAAKPWQKKFIDKGVAAAGFTPDMVYIAMGHPTKVEAKDFAQGHVELWTYARYYPNADAVHGFRNARFNVDSAYQPLPPTMQTDVSSGAYPNGVNVKQVPRGMDRGGGESSAKTGGVQGGSMEPADLQSYTVQVLFQDGKVAQIGAVPNDQ